MTSPSFVLGIFVALGIGVWAASYLIEALRPIPEAPKILRWAPDISIRYIDAGGYKLRYVKAGEGANVVLLHTLRTQLDLFEKIVPELAKAFTIYALDYPGHGYSDIPNARYDANFFVRSVESFLDAHDLRNVTLAGVSIGGTIALIIAGRRNLRVDSVVAINPYDYAKGRGIARSGPAAWITELMVSIPVIGETFMRLRNFPLVASVLKGGVADPKSIPPALLNEMYAVGNRRDHYQGFISLLRNGASWERATEIYNNIAVPVRLVWGDKDWARPAEREHDDKLIPGVTTGTVESGGHFLPLDRPDAVIEEITSTVG